MGLGLELEPQTRDGSRAQWFLDRASDLVRLEAGDALDEDAVPDTIKGIVVQVAGRAFTSSEGALDATTADQNVARNSSGEGAVYLTRPEARLVRRAMGIGLVSSIELDDSYRILSPATVELIPFEEGIGR